MGRILTTPARVSSSIQTVTLGGVDFRVGLTWRERTGSWYLDLYDAEENPLALGRRLSPGWSPLQGLSVEDGPDGMFMVRGPEPYLREDLGVSLLVVFYPTSELPVEEAADDGLVVEVP